MSLFSIPDELLPPKTMLDEVMKQTDALMPAEFTSTVNFMAQPLAGAAAMSAFGVGFASHAFGVWFGTMTAATTASQRMFLPMFEGFGLDVDVFGDSAQLKPRAKDDASTLPAGPQSAADSGKQRTRKTAIGKGAEALSGIHPEEPAPAVEVASFVAPHTAEAVTDQAVQDAAPTIATEAAAEDLVATPAGEMPVTAVEEPTVVTEAAPPAVAGEAVAEQVIEDAPTSIAAEAAIVEDLLATPAEEMPAAAVEEPTIAAEVAPEAVDGETAAYEAVAEQVVEDVPTSIAAEPAAQDTVATLVEEMPTATAEDAPAVAADDTLTAAAEEAPVVVAEAAPIAAESSAPPAAPASEEHSAPASLMPEDFRKPAAIERPEQPDDLKAISGIGPKLEKVLNDLGVWTYAQIADWHREEIAWVDDTLGFKGRIERDAWLAQAAKLASAKTGSSE